VHILPATPADLSAILAIANDVIATSTAIYTDDPAAPEDRAAWFAARQAQGYPVLVARADDDILGFSSFGDFRPWPGYRYTVEHTVHVRADSRGKGIGGALVAALFPHAISCGKHVMIAGVDAANTASLRLHARLGFQQVATFREVGRKFGRWLDLTFLQRFLDPHGAPRP
jgi:phosphinothricin acetyltransferase